MIIINEDCDKNTYIVSVFADYNQYRVSANTEQEAADLVADYLESHNLSHLYYDNYTVKVLAEFSEYRLPDRYAKANGLTCCGTHDIYINIISIKRRSNYETCR